MEWEPVYPLMKVMNGAKDSLYYFPFGSSGYSYFFSVPMIGDGLIDFVELDLTEFENKIKEVTRGERVTSKIYERYTDDETVQLVYDIADMLKGKHQYVHFFLVGGFNDLFSATIHVDTDEEHFAECMRLAVERKAESIAICFDLLNEVVALQAVFKNAVRLCLDERHLAGCSKAVRMTRFLEYQPRFKYCQFRSGISIAPTDKNGCIDPQAIDALSKQKKEGAQQLFKALNDDAYRLNLVHHTILGSLEEMLYFEFCEMLRRGVIVKTCKLCGRYFTVHKDRRREYCDRPYLKGKTCRQAGPKLLYLRDTGTDPVLRELLSFYNTAYSRMYRAQGKLPSELSGKDMTEEQFAAWAEKVAGLRRRYKAGEITGEQLLASARI